MISDFQKSIYNLYLRALRTNNNKPFRAKKDFKKVKDSDILELNKLEKFFTRYPHLFKSAYFDAPYIIYKNDEKKFFGLSFYSSYKALTTCLAYFKILAKGDPDSQMDFLKESLKFVTDFCIEKKIRLASYVDYCSIAQQDCLKHLKEHKISWYVVFAIPRFLDIIYDLPSDEFSLYFGEDIDLMDMKDRLDKSKIAGDYLKKKIRLLSQYIDKNVLGIK